MFFKSNKKLNTEDLKLAENVVPGSKIKIELVDYLKENLEAPSFINGFKNRNFNAFVENGVDINIGNEKRRSS